MNIKILFVDDEPNVLSGLQRMLRSMSHEWEMKFAGSGREALDILSNESFNVVVSDMRMPGMNGVELLTEVMKRYPQTVRIVLSGHLEREMILKSVRPVHQFISKPCDAEKLKSAIARTTALHGLLADGTLKKVVSQIESLPSVPSLYTAIMDELQSPEASIQKIGGIISKDIGMTTKILQLVNSAFFGIPQRITSPAQAVVLLGLETVKALVLSIHIFSRFEGRNLPSFFLDRLWKHSVCTGAFAKAIVKEEKRNSSTFGDVLIDDALMTGLMHDSGKLLLAAQFPGRYGEVLEMEKKSKLPSWEAEWKIFGTSHSEIGCYLLGLWGMRDPILEALAFHHCPNRCQKSEFGLLTAVHVADVLEHTKNTEQTEEVTAQIDMDYLSKVGGDHRLPVWKEVCMKVAQEGVIID
jgi:HD-like signal output (HDOD) protein/ActR/RegA family two-component response regulator